MQLSEYSWLVEIGSLAAISRLTSSLTLCGPKFLQQWLNSAEKLVASLVAFSTNISQYFAADLSTEHSAHATAPLEHCKPIFCSSKLSSGLITSPLF